MKRLTSQAMLRWFVSILGRTVAASLLRENDGGVVVQPGFEFLARRRESEVDPQRGAAVLME